MLISRHRITTLALLALLLVSPGTRGNAANPREPGALSPFSFFFENITDAHTGWHLGWQAGAVGSTLLVLHSGADRKVQDWFQKDNPLGTDFPRAVFVLGNFWHVGAALGIWIGGQCGGNDELATAGALGLQAVGTTFLVTTFEKIMTGRKGPRNPAEPPNGFFEKSDKANDFDFTFWDYDIREGRFFWPSGHTSTAFAFVSAMVAYYPEETWLAWIGYPLALLVGMAMVDGDYHWFSDVAAGAMTGHALGWASGKRFRAAYDARAGKRSAGAQQDSGLQIMPVIGRDAWGLVVSVTF